MSGRMDESEYARRVGAGVGQAPACVMRVRGSSIMCELVHMSNEMMLRCSGSRQTAEEHAQNDVRSTVEGDMCEVWSPPATVPFPVNLTHSPGLGTAVGRRPCHAVCYSCYSGSGLSADRTCPRPNSMTHLLACYWSEIAFASRLRKVSEGSLSGANDCTVVPRS